MFFVTNFVPPIYFSFYPSNPYLSNLERRVLWVTTRHRVLMKE